MTGTEVVEFGGQARGHEVQEVRMGFAEAGQVQPVLEAFGSASGGIGSGPELALHQVIEAGDGQLETQDLAGDGAAGKRGVTGVDGDLQAQPASGQLGIDRVRVFLDHEAARAERLDEAGHGHHGEVRIERDHWLDVMIHGQAPDEAEWLAGGAQGFEGQPQVGVMAGEGGEEFLFGHRGGVQHPIVQQTSHR